MTFQITRSKVEGQLWCACGLHFGARITRAL